jgi:hypothetical protein
MDLRTRHRFCAQGAASAAHAATRAAGERTTAARGNPGQAAFSTPGTPLLGRPNDGDARSRWAAFIRSSCKLTGFRARPSLCTPRAEADRLGMRTVVYVASNGGTWSPGAVGGASISLTTVRVVIAAGGAQIVELRHQAGAVALTLRTEHPAAFLKHHGRALVMALRRRVRSISRASTSACKTAPARSSTPWGWLPAQGMFWTRPDLDACGPTSHSMPVGAREPPCAARA